MANNATLAERLATLESEVGHIIKEHSMLQESIKSMEGKLDELLVLRHKGTGVFWAATTLFGISLISLGNQIMTWVKGVMHVT